MNIIRAIIFTALLNGAISAAAACATPVGVAGELLYFPSDALYRVCNGSAWNQFIYTSPGGTGCAGLAEAEMRYNFVAKAIRLCRLGSPQDIGSALVATGTCSPMEEGKMLWDPPSLRMRLCTGADWVPLHF